MSELTVRGLEKSFGSTPVLRGVDLTVPQGTFAAVLGPSGCGKTTLLRVVAGFATADAGTVALDGRVVSGRGTSLAPEHRRVGIVPQEGALFPHLSVAGNVGFGLTRSLRRGSRVEEMLELVGLAGYGRRMPGELSGGQQQRVAVARALAPGPALVLLDEPFSALDTGSRGEVREDVRTAVQAAGATTVLVTHDQQEALSMADVVAVMRDGRVVQVAEPDALYSRPRDLGVATFVGEAVVLPAVVTDDVAETALGRLPVHPLTPPLPAGGPRTGRVVLRPEQLGLVATAEGVPAHVRGTSFYGHDALVQLSVAAAGPLPSTVSRDAPLIVSARVHGPHRLPRGQAVGLRVSGPGSFYPDDDGDAAVQGPRG